MNKLGTFTLMVFAVSSYSQFAQAAPPTSPSRGGSLAEIMKTLQAGGKGTYGPVLGPTNEGLPPRDVAGNGRMQPPPNNTPGRGAANGNNPWAIPDHDPEAWLNGARNGTPAGLDDSGLGDDFTGQVDLPAGLQQNRPRGLSRGGKRPPTQTSGGFPAGLLNSLNNIDSNLRKAGTGAPAFGPR